MRAEEVGLTREEVGRRGHEIYLQTILPNARPEDMGKYVLIDVLSGVFEMDEDRRAASDRIQARCPRGVFWLERLGEPAAVRFGMRFWRRLS